MTGLRPCRWPWLMILPILSVYCCFSLSEGRQFRPQKVSQAVLVGTVYCDTCFRDDFSKGSFYISGATVAVECKQGGSKPTFIQKVKTDKQGKFRVNLPSSVSKHMKQIKSCNVNLLKSSEPYCAIASTANSSSIHPKETKQGSRIFSAGFFTFKPLKQPEICSQKPKPASYLDNFQGLFPNPNPNQPLLPSLPELPPFPNLPPLPELPPLPPLPRLPSINFIPQKPEVPFQKKMSKPQFFFPPIISPPPTSGLPLPPNPLQPAPLLPNPLQPPVIPIPLQPPAPPSGGLLPPVPTLPTLPPVPGLTNPPPAPPAVPSLPIPLPPLVPLPRLLVAPRKRVHDYDRVIV